MKNNIDKQEIEQLEKFFDEKYEHFEMTPEQWRFMEAARKRGLKKLMLSMGFSGFLIYYSGVIKGFLIKLATTKMVVAAVAGTAVVSAATVAVVKYAQLAGVDEKDKVKEDVVKEVVVDETDSPDVLKKENIEQKKKDIPKPVLGIRTFSINSEDTVIVKNILTNVNRAVKSTKGRYYSKILGPDQFDTKFILAGHVQIHSEKNVRISIKIINTVTSKIVVMKSKTITSLKDVPLVCSSMTKQLLAKVKL